MGFINNSNLHLADSTAYLTVIAKAAISANWLISIPGDENQIIIYSHHRFDCQNFRFFKILASKFDDRGFEIDRTKSLDKSFTVTKLRIKDTVNQLGYKNVGNPILAGGY